MCHPSLKPSEDRTGFEVEKDGKRMEKGWEKDGDRMEKDGETGQK